MVLSTQAIPLFSGVFICSGQQSGGNTLKSCGISEGSTVAFSLSSFYDEAPYHETFFINDVVPSVQQTQKGMSVLLSSLYVAVSSVHNILFSLKNSHLKDTFISPRSSV